MTIVTFTYVEGYPDFGDLAVDGNDLGWQSRDYADQKAADLREDLQVVHRAPYAPRNPRRVP